MTITDVRPALDMRAMTDAELLDLYRSDGTAAAAALAEASRRDQAARLASARRTLAEIRAEGDRQAYAQYRAADDWCRGELLSRAGKAAGITDEQVLWRMPLDKALELGSEELGLFWLRVAPRVTSRDYVKAQAAERRRAQAEAREQSNDGLAGHEAGALRHGTAAEDAESGAGAERAVQRGGHSAAEGDGETAGTGARRPGGPVQRLEGETDMGIVRAAEHHDSNARMHQIPGPEAAPERDLAAERLAAEMAGPGRIVPGEQDAPDAAPADLKFVLDETAEFIARHVACTAAQADVMTLYATATHGLKAFPTFGRMLFAAEREASGKTVAMTVTAALSSNPLDASGTSYALQAALAAASNAPEQLTPTLYYDEISSVFGKSGLAASRDPIGEMLRKGYKQGATRAWSVNRTSEEYSIYTPFLMAGLRNAVPRDIRTRCIVVIMKAGTPKAYFDTREAEPEAKALAACLGQATASQMTDLAAFRARGIHPQLRDRRLEVWEPLFAVAYVLGGQEWLNRCLAAFRELALADSAQVTLTPRQETIRDVAAVTAACTRKCRLEDGSEFMGGLVLLDEMRRIESPRYQSRTEASLGQLVADALPMNTVQLTVDGKRVRGYYAADIAAAWERIRPEDPEDALIPEERNPFEVDDEDCTGFARGDVGVSAGQHEVHEVLA